MNIRIKMVETVPVVLCGCESEPVTLSDEKRQRVTEVIFLWA